MGKGTEKNWWPLKPQQMDLIQGRHHISFDVNENKAVICVSATRFLFLDFF